MKAWWQNGGEWKLLVLVSVFGLVLLGAVPAWSLENLWIDELTNSQGFYKVNYPNGNWAPYEQKLTLVREAVHKGDARIVRTEMGQWFKMLRNRDHGINDVAADELFNFGVLVTPAQEYGIMVPAVTTSNP